MRLSVWGKPRVIGCAQNFPRHIGLPRGCLDGVQSLLREHGIRCELHDERQRGTPIDVAFAGMLRADQEAAVAAMLRHDTGVLCAPTAFGKTVSAAALIARRGVNALVLVHRTELLRPVAGATAGLPRRRAQDDRCHRRWQGHARPLLLKLNRPGFLGGSNP
jgi:hypothetical protein